VKFTEIVSREMAVRLGKRAWSWHARRAAPIMNESSRHEGNAAQAPGDGEGWVEGRREDRGRLLHAKYSRYMQRWRKLRSVVHELAEVGARFTHHTSMPRGYDLLSWRTTLERDRATYRHYYFRNVIRQGRIEEEGRCVLSSCWLLGSAMPRRFPARQCAEKLPDYFTSADAVTPRTRGDPRRPPEVGGLLDLEDRERADRLQQYENSKDIYSCPREGLKDAHLPLHQSVQGVLVKEKDLKKTTYIFTLEDGAEVEVKATRSRETARNTRPPIVRRIKERLLRQL